jgi:hypothetical protein
MPYHAFWDTPVPGESDLLASRDMYRLLEERIILPVVFQGSGRGAIT